MGLDSRADEVLDSARGYSDDVARDRLVFDAERWYLSKMAPKRYGDKITQDVNHGVQDSLAEVMQKVSERGKV